MEASRAAPPPRSRTSLRRPALRLARPSDPAFEQLYRQHAREVYQYALALLTNPADAEDVTQTAFLNAYRAFQRGERPRTPHNWLIAITHNVCRMRWRQAGSRPLEIALEEAPEPVAPEHEHPDLDAVLAALARLSFNQRAALVMRELEGRSYQEIAGLLDVSVGAVEALLFRARRRLRIERKALGILSTAPLPGSLTSFVGAGGGVVAAGGTAIGADLVLKAAAVVAAGALTAGVGFKAAQSITAPAAGPAHHNQVDAKAASPGRHDQRATPRRTPPASAAARRAAPRRAAPTAGAASAQAPAPTSAELPREEAAAPPPPPALTTVAAATTALPPLPVTVPAPPPPPPVEVEPPPLPPLPPLPITVTTPIPPPPPLK